jgi:hypothetical protein
MGLVKGPTDPLFRTRLAHDILDANGRATIRQLLGGADEPSASDPRLQPPASTPYNS